MFECRKNTRYRAIAKVLIAGRNEGEHLLKDLSVAGCCVDCTVYVEIKTGERHRLSIFPESASGIASFELLAEARWLYARDYSCRIGFSIIESPKGKKFDRYVDYLAWRSASHSEQRPLPS